MSEHEFTVYEMADGDLIFGEYQFVTDLDVFDDRDEEVKLIKRTYGLISEEEIVLPHPHPIEEAMDVMAEQWENYDREDPSMDSEWDREMANRLAKAGLLVTDEIRAVLDAIKDPLCEYAPNDPVGHGLATAIAGYLGSRDRP